MPKLTKPLGKSMKIIKMPNFPKKFLKKAKKNPKTEFALLGIGGNVGDVLRTFNKLEKHLNSYPDIRVVATSIILENPPFGYTNQRDFLNSLILIKTSLSSIRLLERVLKIEDRFGRKRSFKDAPRTLDIDLIFHGRVRKRSKRLNLPHLHWRERSSVLIPLKYMLKESNSKKVARLIYKLLMVHRNLKLKGYQNIG